MTLPSGFIEMAKNLLGDEAESFLRAMSESPGVAVRVNSRKPGAHFPDARPVKWCDKGFYLPVRPVFTLDPLLHAGAYYVQDASSMIHYEVVKRILGILCHERTDTPISLLDLCAAPGGKTTAMTDALPFGSNVVANEYMAKRAAILRENVAKWGYPFTTVTNRDSAAFAADGNMFDVVAVDAPCSGEGMMRKDSDAVKQWSLQLIENCASLQREILTNAESVVKPGGFLIYSTCTFNRTENEENVDFAVKELGLEPVELDFPEQWGIPRGISTPYPCWRFMPHKTEGEGLFLAVLRKPGEWEPSRIGKVRKVSKTARPTHGMKKTVADNVPPVEEVLSLDFDRKLYPEADVTLEQALSYLRRESITLPPDVPKGLVTITYMGLPLGMAKNIGSRANNLYPKNWRILMR